MLATKALDQDQSTKSQGVAKEEARPQKIREEAEERKEKSENSYNQEESLPSEESVEKSFNPNALNSIDGSYSGVPLKKNFLQKFSKNAD